MRHNAELILALAEFKRVLNAIKNQEFVPVTSDHQFPNSEELRKAEFFQEIIMCATGLFDVLLDSNQVTVRLF